MAEALAVATLLDLLGKNRENFDIILFLNFLNKLRKFESGSFWCLWDLGLANLCNLHLLFFQLVFWTFFLPQKWPVMQLRLLPFCLFANCLAGWLMDYICFPVLHWHLCSVNSGMAFLLLQYVFYILSTQNWFFFSSCFRRLGRLDNWKGFGDYSISQWRNFEWASAPLHWRLKLMADTPEGAYIFHYSLCTDSKGCLQLW